MRLLALRDVKLLVPDIQDYLDNLQKQIGEIVEECADLALEEMIRIIELSTTKTGEERAANGGHPGRIETGNMRDELRRELFSSIEGGRGSHAWVGWLDDPARYFLAQEYGVDGLFVGMGAMHRAFNKAREHMFDRLQAIGVEFL